MGALEWFGVRSFAFGVAVVWNSKLQTPNSKLGRGRSILSVAYTEYFPCIRDTSRHRGRRHHQRTHQDGAAGGTALAALEVSVGRAGAKLIADQFVRIHRQAHRASGGAPLEPGVGENLVESQFLA